MDLVGQVGAARYGDDTQAKIRLGSYGEVAVSDMNGFFFEQTMRGNGYVFSTALTGNVMVVATTSNAPALLNPMGSGRLCVLQKVAFTRAAVGTAVEGGIVYCKSTINSFSLVAGTGNDIVSGTVVAGVNLRFDLGDNSGLKFFPTTIVTGITPTFICNTGVSQSAATGVATGPFTCTSIDYINGGIVIPPGYMLSLATTHAIATSYSVSIYAFSLPLPLTS